MSTTPIFEESDEFEKGFSDVFSAELAPKTQALEARRRKWFAGLSLLFLMNAVLVFALMFWAIVTLSLAWFVILLLSFAIAPVIVTLIYPDYSEGLHKEVAPVIFKFLGESYDRDASKEDVSAWFQASGLIDWKYQEVEDHLKGSYKGSTYDLIEAELKSKSGGTVFKGLLVRLDGKVDEAGLTDELKSAIADLSNKLSRDKIEFIHYEEKLGLDRKSVV